MAIEIIEQFRIFRNEPLLTRDSVATIADRNNIPVEERFNGIKTIVRSEGNRYEIIYSGNFNSLSVAAQNAFLADNNNWKEVVGNAALDLKEDKANKGVANGYTPLGADTKIPLQYIPDSLLGALEYKGVWSATTNTAPHGSPENGWYYKVNVAGQTTFTGSTVDWAIGDWIIYNGTTWDRVANADKVISVNGYEGEVIIDDSNLEHEPSVSIPTWISSVYTAGVATMRAVFDAVITRIGIMDTQLTDIEDKLDTIEEGANNYSPPDYYGDVEILETGQTTIQQGVVTNQKMSTMPAGTFKAAKVAGYPGNVTTADVKVMLSLPVDTASDLSAAQSAILALQTLVSSDNFNLDTVQEIVDFIEANRDDLNTYVADLNNKVDKEVGKSLISIDEIARLLTMETNAKDDQTATEIRDLLITLTGTNRLPASAIKDIPQTTIVDNLTTQSAVQALSANQGYVINQNLIAKQNAIDSLIQLVASDNFNLDTVQEIVDFIEQNRTDLDTYVSDLAGKLDDITEGTNVTIDKTNPNNPIINAEIDLSYYETPGNIYLLPQAFYVSSINGGGNFSLNDTQILFSVYNQGGIEIISGTNPFLLVDSRTGSNQKGWALQGFNPDNSGPLSIMPKSWIEAQIAAAGGGGTGPTKATQAQAEAGTEDAAYMTALKTLQGIAARVGFGLTWNDVDKRIDLGGSVLNSSMQLTTYNNPPVGQENNPSWYEDWGLEINKEASAGNSKTVKLFYSFNDWDMIENPNGDTFLNSINVGRSRIDIISSSIFQIQLNTTFGLSDTATINDQRSTKRGLEYQADYSNSMTALSLVHKGYVDTTKIGAPITASRALASADTGGHKITPVNSASNVVMTIPADATLNMPIGSTINLRRRGAGSVEIVGAAGVTVEGIQDTNGDYKIVRYGIVSAYKEAANLWVVYGALES